MPDSTRFPAGRLPLVFLAGLLFWGNLPGQVAAQNINYGNVSVFLVQEQREHFSHGYLEYRFRVTNNDSDKPHRVTLLMPSQNWQGAGHIQAITRTVDVGPKSSAMVSLLQPCAPVLNPGSNLIVEIDGRKQEEVFPLSNGTGKRSGIGPVGRFSVYPMTTTTTIDPLLLVSQKVPETIANLFGASPGAGGFPTGPGGGAMPPGMTPGMPSPGMGMGIVPSGSPGAYAVPGSGPPLIPGKMKGTRSPISVTQWSENWLGYTAYDLILITLEELKALESGGAETRPILTALIRYAETGGTLVVAGPGSFSFPRSWTKKKDDLHSEVTVYQAGFGSCFHVEELSHAKWLIRKRPPVARKRAGETSEESELVRVPQAIFELVQDSGLESYRPWQQALNTSGLLNTFPVVDNLSVPIRGLFTLMILFAIIIGPVNFFLLARWNKRIWLLWTVPVISFVFCLAILTYNLFAEGWFSKTRIAGFTILDQTEQRATTIGLSGFYCPLNPGSLHFSPLTDLQLNQDSHPAWSGSPVLNWNEDQNLARGWIMARVPAYFTMRKSEDRRERLNVTEVSDGKIEVVNALGTDIRALYLMTGNGQYYQAKEIGAGASARLEKTTSSFKKDPGALRKYFVTGNWVQGNRSYDESQGGNSLTSALRPGTFIAFTESNPFLENGLKGSYERPSPSGIFGILGDSTANPQGTKP